MKILITGVAGFIGFHLARSLLIDGCQILGIDNINQYYNDRLKYARLELLKSYNGFIFNKIDISDRTSLSDAFKSFQPNKVVNLAAQAGVRHSKSNPYIYIDSNLNGFINVIELSKTFEVDGFIYASSSSVYGSSNKLPFKIDDHIDDPISLYGATKRSNELIANVYSKIYGLNTVGLRYFTVYGPYYRPDMAIFIFTKNIIQGKSIPLYNNGDMKRDFTYIDDIVNGTKTAIKRNFNYEIFNLGNNKAENLLDVVSIIENELNKKAIIEFQPKDFSEVEETCADIDYSKQKLSYDPQISIDKGIPKFIEWYKEYYNV